MNNDQKLYTVWVGGIEANNTLLNHKQAESLAQTWREKGYKDIQIEEIKMQTNIKYSEIKNLKAFCEDLTSQPDWREVLNSITSHEQDFEVDNVRFIDTDSINEIQQEELANDEYVLGCFYDYFLADILKIDIDVIQAIQKDEAYAGLGKLIIEMGKIEELQKAYASEDGYGHHFNHYDGNEEELFFAGNTYHVFDNR